MLRVVVDESSHAELAAGLDELAREGARRMLAMAVEAEAYTDERVSAATEDADGGSDSRRRR
jgi:hypothetical protein